MQKRVKKSKLSDDFINNLHTTSTLHPNADASVVHIEGGRAIPKNKVPSPTKSSEEDHLQCVFQESFV